MSNLYGITTLNAAGSFLSFLTLTAVQLLMFFQMLLEVERLIAGGVRAGERLLLEVLVLDVMLRRGTDCEMYWLHLADILVQYVLCTLQFP